MRKKAGAITLALFMTVGLTSAVTLKKQERQNFNLTTLEDSFNKNSGNLPPFVGSIIGDQTININVSNVETGESLFKSDMIGIKTNGTKIVEIQWEEYEKPTLKIWIDQKDVEKLVKTEKPLQSLKKMLKSGQIEYETVTWGNKIKFGILEFFLGF